jgi:peptidoglycan/xylan/chitin deacetylase (PgdA/CDA1 family)
MTSPRLSVCLTFDFDALSPWAHEMALGNMAAMSRGEFGAVAVPRILALLERHDVPATFFIPGHTALAYPDLVLEIRDAGHEIGHHGFVHEPLSALEPEREREILQRGLEALEQVAGVRPLGYRAPNVDVSVNTVDILLEHGFQYDASFSGSDFEPYYLRHGDRFPPDGPYEFGETVDLVGIPFSWGLSDFQYFEFVPGITVRQDTPSAVYEIWHGELEWAHAHVPGGVYDLTMHPQAIGRGHRLVMAERLIEAAKGLEGIAFERLGDYAARWREHNPLAQWLARSPVHARRTPSG